MLAREMMTRDPLCVLPTDPIWRAAELMRYHGIGCTPVVANEANRRVIGMLTDRDITTRCVARKHGPGCTVAEHMTATPIHAVLEDDVAEQALRLMEQSRVRRLPVLSGDGAVVGIISHGDILRRMGHRQPLAVERALEQVYAESTFSR